MRAIAQTSRLSLRELGDGDLEFVAAMLGDAEVMRYYPTRYTRAEAEEWLLRQQDRYRRHGHGLWLASRRDTGEPIGQIGLIRHQDEEGEPEVGYLLHRGYWGRGYATEAAAAVLDLARRKFNYERVVARIRPVNTPSQAVARRIGLGWHGRRIQHAGYEHWVYEASKPGS